MRRAAISRVLWLTESKAFLTSTNAMLIGSSFLVPSLIADLSR